MTETIITIPNEDPPVQQPLPEVQTMMAIEYGKMTETNRQLMEKISESAAEQNTTRTMLQQALEEIRNLRLQTDTISRREEQLNESLTDIALAQTEDSEKEDSGVIQVTPPMETHIEIDQKPAKRPNLLQRIFF